MQTLGKVTGAIGTEKIGKNALQVCAPSGVGKIEVK